MRQQGGHGRTTGQGYPHQGRIDRGGQEAVGSSEEEKETPYSETRGRGEGEKERQRDSDLSRINVEEF